MLPFFGELLTTARLRSPLVWLVVLAARSGLLSRFIKSLSVWDDLPVASSVPSLRPAARFRFAMLMMKLRIDALKQLLIVMEGLLGCGGKEEMMCGRGGCKEREGGTW
jgi:hypothetical protein